MEPVFQIAINAYIIIRQDEVIFYPLKLWGS